MKAVIMFAIGFSVMTLFFGFLTQNTSPASPEPTISKCDSLQMANDSLKQRIQVLNNRIIQYKIGLQFLKDKDKKSYDYVINAGNFIFND
jgi:cell division protein FtsB